ncbi:MAG: DivIVA domain-containing protein, partial [Thermobispora bispora]|nr:DivIVA domain-containing protein [Thermobispora bispora]
MALRLGYDPQQVDDFVRRIERTLGLGSLDGPPVTADEIRNVRFAVTFGGYNETAVDFALDAFIVAIEAKAGRDAQAPARGTADAVPGPAAGAPVRGGGMVVVRAPEGQGSGGPGAGDREVPPPPAAMTPVTGAAASPASATASPASAT